MAFTIKTLQRVRLVQEVKGQFVSFKILKFIEYSATIFHNKRVRCNSMDIFSFFKPRCPALGAKDHLS